MRQKAFRLSSLDDPSDEQLYAWMKQVGEAARESSRRAEKEMKRRLQNVKEMLRMAPEKHLPLYNCCTMNGLKTVCISILTILRKNSSEG